MMRTLNQNTRILKADFLPSPLDLTPIAIHGQAVLDGSFRYEATFEGKNKSITKADLKTRSVSLTVTPVGQAAFQFHCQIIAFQQSRARANQRVQYQLTLAPWFASLQQRLQSNLYTQQSLTDIFTAICQASSIAHFKVLCKKTFPLIAYCAQYNETDWDFLLRIADEHQAFLCVVQDKDQHTLALCDDSAQLSLYSDNIVFDHRTFNAPHLHQWSQTGAILPEQIIQAGSNFDYPSHPLLVDAQGTYQQDNSQHKKLSVFLHPHQDNTVSDATETTKIAKQAVEVHSQYTLARANMPCLEPGHQFKKDDQVHWVAASQLHAQDDSILSYADSNTSDKNQTVETVFLAKSSISGYQRYRHKTPIMVGYQTALTTTTQSKAIDCQSQGLVSANFHWQDNQKLIDTEKQNPIKISVLQAQVDVNHGHHFSPRHQHEVLVNYRSGNPNQPIITSSTYNTAMRLDNKTKVNHALSQIKTHTINAQSPTDAHAISFDDKKSQLNFLIQSQNTMQVDSKHYYQQKTGGHLREKIQAKHILHSPNQSIGKSAQKTIYQVGKHQVVISASGISIKAAKIYLKAKDAPKNKLLSHIGHQHSCPKLLHHGGVATQGSSLLYANQQKAVRLGDKMKCRFGSDHVKKGVDSITVQHVPVAHLNAKSSHGGALKQGAKHVIIDQRSPIVPIVPIPKVDKKTQADDIVEVMYVTSDATFYLLNQEHAQKWQQSMQEMDELIQPLYQAANSDSHHYMVAVNKQKKALNQKIQPLISSIDSNDITEVIHCKGKKYTYVKSNIVKNHVRKYSLDSDNKKKSVLKPDGSLDAKKIYEKVNLKAELWSGLQVDTALNSWASKIDADHKLHRVWFGTDKDPTRHFKVTADAQLMRFVGGMSLNTEFEPRQGRYTIEGKAHYALSAIDASLNAECYLPSQEGFHLILGDINLGFLRFDISVTVSGFVGASLTANVGVHFDLSHQGQLKVRGTNKLDKQLKHSKKLNKVEAGVDAFAGAKAGGEVAASMKWQNPEDTQAWSEFASLSAEGDACAGIGVAASFSIRFDPRLGRFFIRGKAALVCGFGVSGDVGAMVYADHILQFIKFCYYKVRQNNFTNLGVIEGEAIKALAALFSKFYLGEFKVLEHVAETELNKLMSWWEKYTASFLENSESKEAALRLARKILSHPESLLHTLPEVKGRFLFLLSDPKIEQKLMKDINHDTSFAFIRMQQVRDTIISSGVARDMQILQQAMLKILGLIQCKADYENVVQHMGLQIDKYDIETNEKRLYRALGFYGRHLLQQKLGKIYTVDQIKQALIARDQPETATVTTNHQVQNAQVSEHAQT